ncbi:MAG: DUF4011 domain-containing protein [Gammaproteobacteria bacterium]|nr:DUF4011 domain-containing protein [Gammaproteobacteria bacterium]
MNDTTDTRPQHSTAGQPDAVTQEVQELIEAARAKLLDLSARNRLLNFRHTPTNCLRVIDEMPDPLFERLLNDALFTFDAVPAPSMRELRAYYAAEQNVPRAPNPDGTLPLPNPQVWAQHVGIEPGFELPLSEEHPEERRHADRNIQTLLYHQPLETRLRKLRGDANTAIEETGSNFLYMAFGFLEWRRAQQSERGMLAPLMLIPVEIQRERNRRGQYVYKLSSTGEDLQPNLSLEKLLLDEFGLALPELAENTTPEEYFRRVRRLVKDFDGWRVRRYCTLSLFEFGKLLIYRDLAEENWPKGRGPADNALIRQLLAGAGAGDGTLFASAPPPEPVAIDIKLELVDRADSTQAAALLRALGEASLVIQGPPGTGKSQTITNLIAAALARSKTVLFVSEKLAALEVVRRRLDHLGLGDFVLELHSHKTRKAALIDDLRHRLAVKRDPDVARAFETGRDTLIAERDRLEAYVQAIRSTVGKLELPVADLFFEAGRARLRLGGAGSRLPDIGEEEALEVTRTSRREAHQGMLALGEAVVHALREGECISEHPWAGVSSARVLGKPDELEVIEAARTWAGATPPVLDAARARLADLGAGEEEVDEGLVEVLVSLHRRRPELSEARQAIRTVEGLRESVGRALEVDFDPGPRGLRALCTVVALAAAAPAEPYDSTLVMSRKDGERLQRVRGLLEDVTQLEAKISRIFDLAAVSEYTAPSLRDLSKELWGRTIFAWLDGRWRRARRELKRAIGVRPTGWQQALECLGDAVAWLEARERFANDADAGLICGVDPQAFHRRLEAAEQTRAWAASVQQALGAGLGDTAAAAMALVRAESLTLEQIGDLYRLETARFERVARALDAIEKTATAGADTWATYLTSTLQHPLAARLGALHDNEFEGWVARLEPLDRHWSAYRDAEAAFAARVDLDRPLWFGFAQATLDRVAERVERAVASTDRLSDWLDVDRHLRRPMADAQRRLVESYIRGEVSPEALRDAYDFLLFDRLGRTALAANPVLAEFGFGDQGRLQQRYAKSDAELMLARAKMIAAQLAANPVPRGRTGGRAAQFTQRALIEREAAKQRRHIPIRQLVARAADALQALKPCFMMGPLSVAQYLPAKALRFDLVIFDEASQLRPEEVLGALARGGQAVIVGDSKQLPPTRFFEKVADEEEQDGDAVVDSAQSVLEMAQTQWPNEMLRWHYRSRHPKLIEFSNHHFYGGQLMLFPSPVADTGAMGVRFHFVEGGVFSAQRNEAEAEAIVHAAVAHLRRRPGESIGIAAMNIKQRDLIEQRLERYLQRAGDLDQTLAELAARAEPLFVKNLENVQGDERDVIIISMTYGPPEPGARVPQRFGPINGADGWRRLNVLFTRAKTRMEVFSSMQEADVTPGEREQRGLQALKAFLRFAETGSLEPSVAGTGENREPDSEFELAVLEGLRAYGYECVAQVGSAGFYLDIGVQHPDRPGAYLAGVECDGASYHSSLSARDRDRLRQEVLEHLGWSLERVWSMDWYRDAERELERLHGRLQALLALDRAARAAATADHSPNVGRSLPPPANAGENAGEEEAIAGKSGERTDAASFAREQTPHPRESIPLQALLALDEAARTAATADYSPNVGRSLPAPPANAGENAGEEEAIAGKSGERTDAAPIAREQAPHPRGSVPLEEVALVADQAALGISAAREALEALRFAIEQAHPDYDRGRSLLRPEMLDVLLDRRPADLVEFREWVPVKLRLGTNPDEFEEYGDAVFDVLARTGD